MSNLNPHDNPIALVRIAYMLDGTEWTDVTHSTSDEEGSSTENVGTLIGVGVAQMPRPIGVLAQAICMAAQSEASRILQAETDAVIDAARRLVDAYAEMDRELGNWSTP